MRESTPTIREIKELVVNWHIIEACNFRCRFCYAKWTELEDRRDLWKNHLRSRDLLKALQCHFDPHNLKGELQTQLRWQSLRLSIAGGEPTLLGDRLPTIMADARSLGFSISVITNGSRPDVIKSAAQYIDILAISVDSLDSTTNKVIGREGRNGQTVRLDELAALVGEVRKIRPRIIIKINTVVNAANASENFSILMHAVKPDRWKVMRVLPVLTSALEIDYSKFQDFVERHDAFRSLITVEDNSDMVESYIMVDPHGRFFQNGSGCGGYKYSSPILDVGVTTAFREVNFNPEKFAARYIGRPQEGVSRNEI